MEQLLPRLTIEVPLLKAPDQLFSFAPEALWLEIGFGAGEHLIHQAQHHPEVGMLGGEIFVNGIARLLEGIEKHRIENIRIFPEDARILLEALPLHCLTKIFIPFPDPWPKKKHAKRRLVSGNVIGMMARCLKKDGEVWCITDDVPYMQWMLVHFLSSGQFEWKATCKEDWVTPPDNWMETRYQKKALEKGKTIYFLRFVRK